MTDYRKPLPVPNEDTAPFWEGCRQGQLLLKRCLACGAYRSYPAISVTCPRCLSMDYEWAPASGRGVVYTFGVARHTRDAAWREEIPYTIALVELEEGVRLFTNVVGIDPQQVTLGLPVEVVFDPVTPEISLPRFRPRPNGSEPSRAAG